MSATLMKTVSLAALFGAAALAVAGSTQAADAKPAVEKCYGVNKAGKNDCAAGTHSCAGQATRDMDKTSFVEVPAGVCMKLSGGSLKQG